MPSIAAINHKFHSVQLINFIFLCNLKSDVSRIKLKSHETSLLLLNLSRLGELQIILHIDNLPTQAYNVIILYS